MDMQITLADTETRYIFGGRLAEYRYYDMHQVVEKALEIVIEDCQKEK